MINIYLNAFQDLKVFRKNFTVELTVNKLEYEPWSVFDFSPSIYSFKPNLLDNRHD